MRLYVKQKNKFRVWDFTINKYDPYIYNAGEQFGHPSSVDWVEQQYTGLNDKNNKEIFDGDIVLYSNLRYAVEWDDIGFKWTAICPYYKTFKRSVSVEPFRHLNNGVIVGNIFENPELLKE